jgi:hypothetical protein
MRTEPPTPPWDRYSCDRPANSLYTHKADDGQTDIYERQCWEHGGWADDLARHPDRAAEIERLKAEGRDPGAIAAFAMWHIKRNSVVPRAAR